jgi:integrase
MRRGEVRGLKWGDIDDGLINLTHNFINVDGWKKPKRGKERIVPYLDIVEKAFEEVRKIATRPAPEAYMFESLERPEPPMRETLFHNALRGKLEGIGISNGKKATKDSPAVPSEQKKRNLTFHSLRYTFITLDRLEVVLSDLEIQAIAGHSTRRMMEHYSHAEKVADFKATREKMGRWWGCNNPLLDINTQLYKEAIS